MKKIISIVFVAFFCNVFTYAYASIIRYDITGGFDSEGYEFSGFVDINSDMYTVPSANSIRYDITAFLFTSSAGIAFGESGLMALTPNPAGAGINSFQLNNSYIENYVDKESLLRWSNALTGVWFYGEDGAALTNYTVLPYEISVFPSYLMRAGGGNPELYWGPDIGHDGQLLTLTRSSQPIPEPATMMLLGGGLFGLAGMRKKFRK